MKDISRAFNYKDAVSWKSKLIEVHKDAWEKWGAHLSQKPLYKLSAERIQQPGVIAPDVFADLSDVVGAMPPKTKYGKKL